MSAKWTSGAESFSENRQKKHEKSLSSHQSSVEDVGTKYMTKFTWCAMNHPDHRSVQLVYNRRQKKQQAAVADREDRAQESGNLHKAGEGVVTKLAEKIQPYNLIK